MINYLLTIMRQDNINSLIFLLQKSILNLTLRFITTIGFNYIYLFFINICPEEHMGTKTPNGLSLVANGLAKP